MNNDIRERLKQYLEDDVIYTEYKSGKMVMSDFDKFCIEHCKDIECLLNEVQELKEVIDKAIELVNDPWSLESGNEKVDEITLQKKKQLLAILREVK